MNRFTAKPAITHITLAVVLIGAAVTIGLAIRESQKGKSQGPAIIDNRRVSHGQSGGLLEPKRKTTTRARVMGYYSEPKAPRTKEENHYARARHGVLLGT
jgi:hypothetical protein